MNELLWCLPHNSILSTNVENPDPLNTMVHAYSSAAHDSMHDAMNAMMIWFNACNDDRLPRILCGCCGAVGCCSAVAWFAATCHFQQNVVLLKPKQGHTSLKQDKQPPVPAKHHRVAAVSTFKISMERINEGRRWSGADGVHRAPSSGVLNCSDRPRCSVCLSWY